MRNLKINKPHLFSYHFLFILLLGLFGISTLSAGEVFNATTNVPYDDLQRAIDEARSGDTLKLEGTFRGNFKIIFKPERTSLTLIGQGKQGAILDGNQRDTVLEIIGGNPQLREPITSIILENLTIQNGSAPNAGGGIYNRFANLSLVNVFVTQNIANASEGRGGGIANERGNLSIHQSTVNRNFARVAGGISHSGGTLFISDSKIKHNTALQTTFLKNTHGGGIVVENSTNTIINTVIAHNLAFDGPGGGLFNGMGSTTTIITNDITNSIKIEENQATFGGGIFNMGELQVFSSKINANKAKVSPGSEMDTGIGGGLYNQARSLAIFIDSTIKNNTAENPGGGVFNADLGTFIRSHTPVENNKPNNIEGSEG